MYASSNDNVGVDEGSNTVILTEDNLPAHTHTKGTMKIVGQLGGGYGGYITNNKWESGCLYTHSNDGNQSAGGSGQTRYHIGIDTDRNNSWTGETSSFGKANPDAIDVRGAVRRVYIYYRQS